MRQRYVTSSFPPIEFRSVPAELPASWILIVQWIDGTSWQFNREHRTAAILSILSIFRLARPHSKTVFGSLRPFLFSFYLSLLLLYESSPFFFITVLHFLSVHLPFYVVSRRDDATPRNASERIVSRDRNIGHGIANDTANGVSNIVKIIGGTIEWSEYIFEKIDICVYSHEKIIFV